MVIVGVLALQGAFAKHRAMLERIGVKSIEVRQPKELEKCEALIIPGGESTTLQKRIQFIGLEEPLKQFGQTQPVFGTCAGLILMSQFFGWLDVDIERNGYGRQLDSFTTVLKLDLNKKRTMRGVFIRAPKIISMGSDVTILASYQGSPVAIQQGHYLATSFHPELTEDDTLHRYFLNFVQPQSSV